MPVLVLFLCLIGNYFTYHSKGDLVQVKEEIYSPVVEYYQGTTISINGTLENIYFNINYTNEEIIELFDKNFSLSSDFSFTDGSSSFYPFEDNRLFLITNTYSSSNNINTNTIVFSLLDDSTYFIGDYTSSTIYWDSINGWSNDIISSNGVLPFNAQLSNSYLYSYSLGSNSYSKFLDVGFYNYLFNDFISSTPIEFISNGGDLIREETKYLTFEEYIGEEYTIPSEFINGQFIDSISLNTNLSETEMLDIFQNALDYSEGADLFLFSFEESITFGIFDLAKAGTKDGCVFGVYIDNDLYCLYCPSFLYNSLLNVPDVLIQLHISNVGWNNLDLFPLEINSIDYEFDSFLTDYPLLITSEKVVSTLEKVNLSFFDITLIQTDNTFIKFQLPFLRNAFESVFNILNFESSYVSSFVLTSFTWMIQLLLLHVVVDTLAFIFKMYHKLMDKVV